MQKRVLFAALICATSLLAQSVQPDVKSGKRRIGSLVLMPVQVRLTKLGMKGPEAMTEESQNTEIPLGLEIAAALRASGYTLDQATFSHQALAKDNDLRDTVDDLQKRFDRELQQIERKSKDVKKGRFSIGDEVAKLPLDNDPASLLFVRANGTVLTESKKTFGTFIAGPGQDRGSIELVIVDAKNGDVLYFAKTKFAVDFTYEVEDLARQLANALAELPRASTQSAALPHSPANSTSKDVSTDSQPHIQTDTPVTSSESEHVTASTRRIRVSHAVLQDLIIRSVPPVYPGIASMNNVEGDVVLRIEIDSSGKVTGVKVRSGALQLIPAATDAAKQFRYRPLTLNGENFEVETELTFTFALRR